MEPCQLLPRGGVHVLHSDEDGVLFGEPLITEEKQKNDNTRLLFLGFDYETMLHRKKTTRKSFVVMVPKIYN